MDCEHIKLNIPSLLTDGLSPDECHGMLRHMGGCAQRRHEVEELKKTWKLMDQWKIEEPSAMIKSRLIAAVNLIFIMAIGITAGSLSGGTGTFWVLNRMKMEA